MSLLRMKLTLKVIKILTYMQIFIKLDHTNIDLFHKDGCHKNVFYLGPPEMDLQFFLTSYGQRSRTSFLKICMKNNF